MRSKKTHGADRADGNYLRTIIANNLPAPRSAVRNGLKL